MWPMNIDVNGYPAPKVTPAMRTTLHRLRTAHAHRELLDPPRWDKVGDPRWPHPRTATLNALCHRGLAQFIRVDDNGGYWRMSATGRRFILK